ncbi:MAG: ABC transporter ATP-binding protein [Lachnospiraceae bacterium]|nr:ABC transporter ATP-binding protein [Lachnospiraceae bacterium]
MDTILKFENFGFKYDAQTAPTLYDINFSVKKGEKVLIAGPSGCGKSTLVHCINGLVPFSYKGEITGSLSLFGKETRDMSLFEISKHVGTVLQDSDAQFVGLTVAEDIAFALENDCVGEPRLHDRVYEVAKLVNIQDFLDHAPTELSGGQKQRVSLGGVLVDDVELLIFDEPLANLDPATGKQAIELIDKLQKETGVAVIIVEHRVEDVLHRSVDRMVLMDKGRIVADTTPDELLSTNLLIEKGVREPLYLSAMKYAGINVTPALQPGSIDTMHIGEEEARLIRDWYEQAPSDTAPNTADNILDVRNLSFSYDGKRKAIDDISIKIKQGEMLAIVGTNGAGKSTFSKVLCGFEKENAGEIFFEGIDFSQYSIKERADRIGYVMQNPNQMISKVMIFDEVALGLVSRGVPEDEIKTRVENTLKICGLWPFRNWPVAALSYGQKKRVTIASIMVLEPKVIILDEPTAGQDYRHYTEIMEFLTELNKRGITVIMITHDMHLMLEYADRSVAFSDGRIIKDADCASILTDEDIINRASLKETSLYELCKKAGITDGTDFVRRFISYEREVVRK